MRKSITTLQVRCVCVCVYFDLIAHVNDSLPAQWTPTLLQSSLKMSLTISTFLLFPLFSNSGRFCCYIQTHVLHFIIMALNYAHFSTRPKNCWLGERSQCMFDDTIIKLMQTLLPKCIYCSVGNYPCTDCLNWRWTYAFYSRIIK